MSKGGTDHPDPAHSQPGADERMLAADVAGFGWDLFHMLRSPGSSICLSPYSISMALAMAYAGAVGETARQMAEVVRFSLPGERLHRAFESLSRRLIRGAGEEARHGNAPTRLDLLNGLWVQQGYPIRDEFMKLLIDRYSASLRDVDFHRDTEGSRREINRWASEGSQGRIPELVSPGAVDAMTTLILTNAVFFKGEWLHVFDPDSTEEGSFLLQSGQSVRVPMMRQSAEFGYLRRKDFQAIRLPYSGREIALLVILPDEGRFDTLAQAFDPTLSADVNRELSRLPVRLKMPRFRLRSALHAKDGLAKLGLHNPFSAEANFGGISPMGDLFISELLHQSHISLDEAGTEATAASAVAMSRSMPSHEMVILTVDRPFLFVIHDLPSDTALFLGQVMDPSGERELSVANPAR